MVKYHFDSLADMAELFAENARKIRARVPNASPQSKRIMQSEAHAWEQAATIAKDAVFAPRLPAGAVITPLSHVGADSPKHPSHEAWLAAQKVARL